MTSIRRFAKNIENRKDLVKKISSITGIASRYTGMPKASYEIDNFTVEKDGTLAVTMTEDGNEGAVILALKADSMIGEEIIPSTTEATTPSTQTTDHADDQTTETTVQLTHSDDDEEADNDPAYSSVEDIDEEQTDSPVADTEIGQQTAISEFVPVNDDDDFSTIGIEDWEPEEAEEAEQTSEQTELSNQTDEEDANAEQASELQQPVTEEHQQGIEELDEQEIEPQQYADLEELESWEEPQNLPEDETVADNDSASMVETTANMANTATSDETDETDEADSDDQSLAVSFPIHQHTPTSLINLVCMIHSRGPLLSKATGGHFGASKELADALLDHGTFSKNRDVVGFINNYLASHSPDNKSATGNSDKHAGGTADTADTANPAEIDGGGLTGLTFDEDEWRVVFDGFPASLDPDHIKAFTNLATAMNKMAQKQKRIQAKTVNDSNEKYALRIWLVRLDMNGDEHKEDRKILMENLTGHTAFRTDAEKEKWMKRQLAKKLELKEQKEEQKKLAAQERRQELAAQERLDQAHDHETVERQNPAAHQSAELEYEAVEQEDENLWEGGKA